MKDHRSKGQDRHLRHAVLDLVQRDVQPELGSRIRERVPSRLTRKRRATRQPRIDLDDAVFPARRVKRILDVTLADDAQVSDDVDRGRTLIRISVLCRV